MIFAILEQYLILTTLLVLLAIGMTRIHNDWKEELTTVWGEILSLIISSVVHECEQWMIFLELLFCGQSPHPTKYLVSKCHRCHFSLRPSLNLKIHNKFSHEVRYMLPELCICCCWKKIFGQNSALVKAVNADASWRFSPETYFRAPARLKICSLLPPCHQNPLWKAHSCNLCRNDAENFPSKPFCWRARFTCWTLAYMH